jgi:hypothetical protein
VYLLALTWRKFKLSLAARVLNCQLVDVVQVLSRMVKVVKNAITMPFVEVVVKASQLRNPAWGTEERSNSNESAMRM